MAHMAFQRRSAMGNRRLFIVDVFAEEKYSGNQLAVVADGQQLAAADMQRIAREMNFSETSFVVSGLQHNGGYDVRIFTPVAEVPFAGHPTIGTAHVIRHEVIKQFQERVVLNLQVGQVPVTFATAGDGSELLWMHTKVPEFGRTHPPEPLAELLGLSADEIDTRVPIEEVSLGVPFTIIPLKALASLRRAKFSRERHARLRYREFAECLFLMCPETYSPANQLNVRLFADSYGVPEDPATGSANACLGAYLLKHQYFLGQQIDIRVEQGHEIGRPSLLRVRAELQASTPSISVGGRVIMTARGELV
jgi:trans-2,3-dihydro-3-hydroxyanthranilate isomerase